MPGPKSRAVQPPREPCIAVIADMVQSRTLSRQQRPAAQREFTDFVNRLNAKYRTSLISKFAITLGDECQGLLGNSRQLPEMLWDMQFEFTVRPLRVGIGFGLLDTPLQEYAINIDGPVLHHARAAIEEARAKRKLGGVFRGFNSEADVTLNGFARILHHYRSRLGIQQRNVIARLRHGLQQNQIAEELGISRQAVSLYAKKAGWDAYREAEDGWLQVLSPFVSKTDT